ncbi:hypothetical protein PS6_002231 [Mucor atramentarius]
MSSSRSSSARVHHNRWSNTPIHTIICTNSNKNSTKRSSFEAIIHHPRRLGSGSACERCRSRKTKCDGGQPCSFCASHGIQCVHRQTKKKRNSFPYAATATASSDTGTVAAVTAATPAPINDSSTLDVNVQLPSLYRQHREPAEHSKQINSQSSYFDKGIQQESIKMSDGSSTDSSISSICSMHVPEEKFGKQIHAKSAALFVTDPHPESWSSKSANIKMPSMLGKEKQVDD